MEDNLGQHSGAIATFGSGERIDASTARQYHLIGQYNTGEVVEFCPRLNQGGLAKRQYTGCSSLLDSMEIDHCQFPDDILYDTDSNTWARLSDRGQVTVGITSILSALAGIFTSARLKPPGTSVVRGRSLGTLESGRLVGPIPSPLSGLIIESNNGVASTPKMLNDSPYDNGWVAKLKPSSYELEKALLSTAQSAKTDLREKIQQYRARCFKAFPDHEMFEIGVECAAVIVRLNELVATLPLGGVVHVVSDDPTAYVEMERWVDQTGNQLVEWRTESNLFHFIVRKANL